MVGGVAGDGSIAVMDGSPSLNRFTRAFAVAFRTERSGWGAGLVFAAGIYRLHALPLERFDHVGPWSEHADPPIAKHQNALHLGQGAGPMPDHDDRGPLRFHGRDRLIEGIVALDVEACVRLVQDHQFGIAVKRPRKSDALPLPAREHGPAVTDLGVVAAGQPQDHVMAIGKLRRGDDGGSIGLPQPRDILGNRAGEKLHILRQVAQVPADLVPPPVEDLRPIQPHRAGSRRVQADQHPGQGRFSGGRGADHRHGFSRTGIEGDAFQDGLRAVGMSEDQIIDDQGGRPAPAGSAPWGAAGDG